MVWLSSLLDKKNYRKKDQIFLKTSIYIAKKISTRYSVVKGQIKSLILGMISKTNYEYNELTATIRETTMELKKIKSL